MDDKKLKMEIILVSLYLFCESILGYTCGEQCYLVS